MSIRCGMRDEGLQCMLELGHAGPCEVHANDVMASHVFQLMGQRKRLRDALLDLLDFPGLWCLSDPCPGCRVCRARVALSET